MKNIGAFSIATPNLGGNAGILDTILPERMQPQEAKRKRAGTDCYRQNRSIWHFHEMGWRNIQCRPASNTPI